MRIRFPHERLEKKWWRDWWSEDFSWPALAFKRLLAGGQHGEKTLQEYWRREPGGAKRSDAKMAAAGELIRDPKGRLWHVLHVPLHWPDGTPAKAAWTEAERERLSALIAARLVPTARTTFSFSGTPVTPDGRVQLQGAVLLDPPSAQRATPGLALRACCDFSWLPAWNATEETFADGASFRRALFHGPVRFNLARFEAGAYFERAHFLDDVLFGSKTEPPGAVQFQELVNFQRAIFLGQAGFDGCGFQVARFDQAHFAAASSFFATRFKSAIFEGATFDGPASFLSAQVSESLTFGAVHARSALNFSGVKLARNASLWFRNSRFDGQVQFMGAELPRRHYNLMSAFAGARFSLAPYFELAGRFWIAALDRATLERGILLEPEAPAVTEREFMTKVLPDALKPPAGGGDHAVVQQLLALAGGCRVLKQSATKTGDNASEELYERLEKLVNEHIARFPVPPIHAAPDSNDE